MRVPTEILKEFLIHGVPFAFPALIGPTTPGVFTSHKSPAFHGLLDAAEGFVWPHPDGPARGASLLPLVPGAAELTNRNPKLYELPSIVDALRVGSTRVRNVATTLLAERLAASGV